MSFNSNIWEERLCQWKLARERLLRRTGSQEEIPDPSDLGSVDEMELRQPEMDNESRQFLSRKVPIPPSMIYPYRVSVIFRLVILVFFLRYRLTHPVHNAYGLWLASVFCEVWFSVSWILDQLPKWQPVNRQTFPERLCMR